MLVIAIRNVLMIIVTKPLSLILSPLALPRLYSRHIRNILTLPAISCFDMHGTHVLHGVTIKASLSRNWNTVRPFTDHLSILSFYATRFWQAYWLMTKASLNIKVPSYQNRNPHYKHKTVSRPCYFLYWEPLYPYKWSLYWCGALGVINIAEYRK